MIIISKAKEGFKLWILGYKTFEDTKWVISIRESKKDRQYNGQKKKDKQRSKKHNAETKDRATRTEVNSGAPER